jgi:hypothetical protein
VTSHRALRAILAVLAVLAVLAGILILFATKPLLLMTGTPATFVAQPAALLLFKTFGAVAIPVGYLLYVTSRDPVRYASIIDAMVIGLVLVVLIELYGLFALRLTDIWSPLLLWTSVVVRTLLAIVLFALRPRERG